MGHNHEEYGGRAAIIHLLLDHRIVREVLDSLELKLRQFEAKNEISISFMVSLTNFLSKFLDKCHHGKEEKCLFPSLEKLGVPREGGPIGVMISEHAEMKRLLNEIKSRLEEYSKGNVKAADVIGPCYDFINLVRSHFFKEENIVFRIGAEIMSKEESFRTVDCYEGIEREVNHEKVLKEAEELKKT